MGGSLPPSPRRGRRANAAAGQWKGRRRGCEKRFPVAAPGLPLKSERSQLRDKSRVEAFEVGPKLVVGNHAGRVDEHGRRIAGHRGAVRERVPGNELLQVRALLARAVNDLRETVT